MHSFGIDQICFQLSPFLSRINNATETDRILKEVENKLRSYPFEFKEAVILSGQQEGAYGWVTVNYLHENFAKVNSDFSSSFLFHTGSHRGNPLKRTVNALWVGLVLVLGYTRLYLVVVSKLKDAIVTNKTEMKHTHPYMTKKK